MNLPSHPIPSSQPSLRGKTGSFVGPTRQLARLIFALLIVLVSGCETCKRHPTACAVGAGLLVTALVLSCSEGKGSSTPQTSHDVFVPKVNCTAGSCQ